MSTPTADITKAILEGFENHKIKDFKEPADARLLREKIQAFKTLPPKLYHSIVAGGEIVEGKEIFPTINPNRPRQVIAYFSEFGTNSEQIEYVVNLANEASKKFARLPLEARIQFLNAAADIFKERELDFVVAPIEEVGKNPREAHADWAEGYDFLRYYAKGIPFWHGSTIISSITSIMASLLHRPIGSIISGGPFNFPAAIVAGQDGLGLSGANASISKPSPYASLCGMMVFEVFEEALRRLDINIPGLVNIAFGGAKEMQAFLQSPNIRGVSYTGGLKGAREIQDIILDKEGIGYRVMPLAFESNGVNAITVLDDATLETALNGTLRGLSFGAQKCSAPRWLLVQEGIYLKFRERLIEGFAKVKVGPVEPEVDGSYNYYGALIREHKTHEVLQKIEDFKTKGVKILVGENPIVENPEGGVFMRPVLGEVSLDVLEAHPELRGTEIFGPYMTLLKVKDLEQALRIENMTRFALTGGLYTHNKEAIRRYVEESRVPKKYINTQGGVVGAKVGDGFGAPGNTWSGLGNILGAGGPFTGLRAILEGTVIGEP